MRPTKTLIRGLRETAQRLRDGTDDYCWTRSTHCNCGLLARSLLGVDAVELLKLRWEGDYPPIASLDGCWSVAARQGYCARTGLPTHTLFKALAACGVEREDYERIEYLEQRGDANFDEPANVAAWMDAEADKLEARRAAGERPERGTP